MSKEKYLLSRNSSIKTAKKLSELEDRFNRELNSAVLPTGHVLSTLSSDIFRYRKISMMLNIEYYRKQIAYKDVRHIAQIIDAYHKKEREGKIPFELRIEN